MKKNVFSRTLAVLASTAVLGAASMISANAAGATIAVTSAEALPGETVSLQVTVDNNNVAAIDAVVTYPAELNGTAAVNAAGVSGSSQAWVDGDGFTSLAIFTDTAFAEGAVVTIDFTVPEDAKVGTVYEVGFSALNTVGQYDPDADITADSATVGGTITVIEPPTDAPTEVPTDAPTDAPTVEETTVEETTEAPTEAPTAEVTTKATTKATTKPPQGTSPKTGVAGVAVAVAGLVAAGATAVVLKKKH